MNTKYERRNEINPDGFVVIPNKVYYDNTISDGAKMLYGSILSLSIKQGYCYANNDYFSEMHNVSNSTVTRFLKELEDKILINREQSRCGFVVTSRKIFPTEVIKSSRFFKQMQADVDFDYSNYYDEL